MPTSAGTLEIEDLSVRYGPVRAVDGLSLAVPPGAVVAVLGPNGAGKSSLLRSISGMAPIAGGRILLDGASLHTMRSHAIARAGVAHVPEGRRVIETLNVADNLMLAGMATGRTPKSEVAASVREIFELFPRLGDRRTQQSGLLSGGEQQMLAIARGLLARPRVLLLDEPSMGLAPVIIEEIYAFIRRLREGDDGPSLVLAEQSANMAMTVADRVHVMSQGRVQFAGAPDDLIARGDMLQAYFGA